MNTCNTDGDTRRPLLFTWALTALLLCSDLCLPECLLLVRVLTGNTLGTLLLSEHCGMEPQQPCLHQASKFNNPLTSCNNFLHMYCKHRFFLLYGLQLDVMLNREKNSLQTHIRCYVSPIFTQSER